MPNQVQNNLANMSLSEFNRPVGVSIIPAGQSWKDRQQVQYESMKGLLYKDFHGLDDFYEQMKLYSSSNAILKAAWSLIVALVPRNRKILQTLIYLPGLGLVGKYLSRLVGFEKSFVLPNEILEDPAALKESLG